MEKVIDASTRFGKNSNSKKTAPKKSNPGPRSNTDIDFEKEARKCRWLNLSLANGLFGVIHLGPEYEPFPPDPVIQPPQRCA